MNTCKIFQNNSYYLLFLPLPMTSFTDTKSYSTILDFIEKIMLSIKNDKNQQKNKHITSLLTHITTILTKIDAHSSPQRFGNSAFRTFYDKLQQEMPKISSKYQMNYGKSPFYLIESFGNPTRIDYGTGHELNFICHLYVLHSLNKIEINEMRNALDMYFDLVRSVINKYTLEPAGSHGVWGIDDYQILPFLLGSSELHDTDFRFEEILRGENTYLYGKALKFVESQKCKFRYVSFEVHSPILYEYGKRGWSAVNYELFLRYKNDVLESKAVNQHFIYSDYLIK